MCSRSVLERKRISINGFLLVFKLRNASFNLISVSFFNYLKYKSIILLMQKMQKSQLRHTDYFLIHQHKL